LDEKNSSTPTLKNGERVVENDLDKASLLNKYFANVLINLANYIDDDISMFDGINQLLCPENFCLHAERVRFLLSLDIKKANGWNGKTHPWICVETICINLSSYHLQ